MGSAEQLEWEARAARPAAAAALASAALLVAGFVFQLVAIESRTTTPVERAMRLDVESADLLVASSLQSLAVLLLGGVLWYLYRATKARRPELPKVALVLSLAAPLVLAIVGIAFQVRQTAAASDLFAAGPVTPAQADDLLRGNDAEGFIGVNFGASLALGFAMVLVNLNAMRAGLLSRFMGIVGIIIGALFVIPLIGSPFIIQLFWTAALGFLFLDRWPGGRGPAWRTVEALPWPSAAKQREEALRRRQERERDAQAEESAPSAEDAPTGEAEPPPKRKRKRRR